MFIWVIGHLTPFRSGCFDAPLYYTIDGMQREERYQTLIRDISKHMA